MLVQQEELAIAAVIEQAYFTMIKLSREDMRRGRRIEPGVDREALEAFTMRPVFAGEAERGSGPTQPGPRKAARSRKPKGGA